MPIDPGHGRFIPAGQRLGRTLAAVLRAYLPSVTRIVSAGQMPDLSPLQVAINQAAYGTASIYWRAGVVNARRELRRLPRRKAWFDPDPASVPPPLLTTSFELLDPNAEVAIRRLTLDLAGNVTETIREQIREALEVMALDGRGYSTAGALISDIFAPQRAQTIAMTEGSRLYHDAEATTWREAGIEQHQWLASSDACDLCLSLSGNVVRIGQPFYVHSGGRITYRMVLYPPAHPHCMCTTTPVV